MIQGLERDLRHITSKDALYSRGHPLAEEGVSLKAFRAAQHIAVVAKGTGHGMVDEVIQRAG